MKLSRALCLLSLCLPLAACDKGPKSSEAKAATTSQAPVGQAFGEKLALAETTSIDAILADPNAYKGKTVRVEGMITDVCPKRGCWFDMAGGGPGKKLKFKVTDGVMVFPVDAKGKHAVAEGVVAVRERSVEESKKYAEYQQKEYGIPYDPESITKPTLAVQLDGKGAVIRDQK